MLLQLLSTMTNLETEESGLCRELEVVEKFN